MTYLIGDLGMKETAAEQELRPSGKRFMQVLLENNVVERQNEGKRFIVVDGALVSILSLLRG